MNDMTQSEVYMSCRMNVWYDRMSKYFMSYGLNEYEDKQSWTFDLIMIEDHWSTDGGCSVIDDMLMSMLRHT